MKNIVYKIINAFAQLRYGNSIGRKSVRGLNNKFLSYEKAQHLTFLFQRKIGYESRLQNRIKGLIKTGDIIFDIGANIGQYMLPFSEWSGSKGKVYSFEPDYNNFAFLQFNSAVNFCKNVNCLNMGVGGIEDSLTFYRDTKTGGRRGSFKKEYVGEAFDEKTEEVRIRTFESLVKEYGSPHFVKIDIEGYEADLVQGIKNLKGATKFLIEVRKETKTIVFNHLKSLGYNCICIDEGDVVINTASDIPDFANLLFQLE